jgi:hypothetical protein
MLSIKNYNRIMRVCVVCTALTGLLPAARADVGLTLKAGTLGLGADLTFPIVDKFNVRVGGNYFQYDYRNIYSKIKYDAKLKLGSGLTTFDWYPLSDDFHLSAGGLFGDNKISLTGKASVGGSYIINGKNYTEAEVGNLTSHVSFDGADPYVGIGWGNATRKDGHWSVTLDLGGAYQGRPKVEYTTDGTLTGNPSFESDLNAERSKTRHDLDFLTFYPVISGGVAYKF